MFQGRLNGVSRKVLVCFKELSRVFQGSFNGVLRMFQEVSGVFKGSFKEVLRTFRKSFEGVSRKFQGCFK